MQSSNSDTQPHGQDARRDAIQATEAMPTETAGTRISRTVTPETGEHTQRREKSLTVGGPNAEAEKMLSGGEELRSHDFPIPAEAEQGAPQRVAEPMGEAPRETIRSGGEPGRKTGDRQQNADVPTVMDQVLSQPSALPDK